MSVIKHWWFPESLLLLWNFKVLLKFPNIENNDELTQDWIHCSFIFSPLMTTTDYTYLPNQCLRRAVGRWSGGHRGEERSRTEPQAFPPYHTPLWKVPELSLHVIALKIVLGFILIIFWHREKLIVKVWCSDSIVFENAVYEKGWKKITQNLLHSFWNYSRVCEFMVLLL